MNKNVQKTKRMEPKEEDQRKTKRKIKKPKKPNGFYENRTKPKKPDKDKEDDKEKDKEDDKDIKEKNKKRKTFEDIFNENSFSEELKSTLKDFIDMRKTIKKPMTSKALELLLRNLEKLTNLEEEKIAILNQSIEHGWQTVYPLKKYTSSTNEKGGMNDFKELWEEARREDEQAGNSSSNNSFSW